MPIHLPRKARVKAVPARRQAAVDSIDWLGLWALSGAFCAIVLAGVAYFMNTDNIGASCILAGAAAIIAIVARFGADDNDEARDGN
jgi:energy-converting hydrogenase Eha subunit G